MNSPRTFIDAMSDANSNPFISDGEVGNRYAEFLKDFAPSRSDEDVLQSAVEGFQDQYTIGGLGKIVASSNGEPIVHLLFGLKCYARNVLERNTDLQGQIFAYSEDVEDGEAPLVKLIESNFSSTPAMNVFKLGEHYQQLQADPSLLVIKSPTDDSTTVESVKTRTTMFIPYEFVPVLASGNLSPRAAFISVYKWALQGNLVAHCQALLDFLRVGTTMKKGMTGPPVVVDQVGKAVHVTNSLRRVMKETVILATLPALRQPVEVPTGSSSQQLCEQLADAQLRLMEESENCRAKKVKEKPVESYFAGIQLRMLYQLTHIFTPEQVPPIYGKIASASKKTGHHQTVLNGMEMTARDLEISCPIAPTAITDLFKSLKFHGFNEQRLDTAAMSPYVFVPDKVASEKGRTARETLLNQGAKNQMWMDSHATLTGSDLNEAQKFSAYLPQNFVEAQM